MGLEMIQVYQKLEYLKQFGFNFIFRKEILNFS